MNKFVTATLLGAAFSLAACGDSYEEADNAEAYEEEAADTTYTAPADETPAPEPTGTDTPEPEPTDTAAPEPAAPDDY